MDASHQASIRKGAAYFHMLAHPFVARPVRPPHESTIPTAIVSSRGVLNVDFPGDVNGSGALITFQPGVAAAASQTATGVANAKICVSMRNSTGVHVGTQANYSDPYQVSANAAWDMYRPIAMGVRVAFTSRQDNLCGLMHVAQLVQYQTGTATETSARSVSEVTNAVGCVRYRPGASIREFTWMPFNYNNTNFTEPDDTGPENTAGGTALNKNRMPQLAFYYTGQFGTATSVSLEYITVYEMIANENLRDQWEHKSTHLSNADLTAAKNHAAAGGGSSMSESDVQLPKSISASLASKGFVGGIGHCIAAGGAAALEQYPDGPAGISPFGHAMRGINIAGAMLQAGGV